MSLRARATTLRLVSARASLVLRITVSFSLSPLPWLAFSLRPPCARYLDSSVSFSVALFRKRFFVPRFVPDTRRTGPLRFPLSLSRPAQRSLATAASVRVLRPSGCFPSLLLPLALSLFSYSFPCLTRAPRINPSPFRATYLLSRRFSRPLFLSRSSAFIRAFLPLSLLPPRHR